MKIELSFSQDDIYRLFLTFRHNQDNYQKIKERVIGDGARVQFRREMRGKWIFLAGISFIAVASSLYPMVAGDWQSAGALWVLWAGCLVVFFTWYIISYQLSYRVLKKNEVFFEDFEHKAEQCQVLEDFRRVWEGKTFE